ncbi:MAG: hypothetical protein NTY83_00050 [Candidatus Micrarchaeota archaeon]|nr:hypothetical protein [Candidatus Micrarchaeota archaeon]
MKGIGFVLLLGILFLAGCTGSEPRYREYSDEHIYFKYPQWEYALNTGSDVTADYIMYAESPEMLKSLTRCNAFVQDYDGSVADYIQIVKNAENFENDGEYITHTITYPDGEARFKGRLIECDGKTYEIAFGCLVGYEYDDTKFFLDSLRCA